jgi:hypothetical protein
MCAAMASTGTRLLLASNSPLIRCRLPGPQLPAHTASSRVSAASAPAANAAASSCRTCCQVISPSRRNASVNPFSESPGSPYTRRTPDAFSVETITSATVAVIVRSFRLCHVPADQRVAVGRLSPGPAAVPGGGGNAVLIWVCLLSGACVNSTVARVVPYFVPAGGQGGYRPAGVRPACQPGADPGWTRTRTRVRCRLVQAGIGSRRASAQWRPPQRTRPRPGPAPTGDW